MSAMTIHGVQKLNIYNAKLEILHRGDQAVFCFNVLQPGLHYISKVQMEKCRQLEEQLQQMTDALRHFDDMIRQHRDELASIVNAVTSIDGAAEQSKQVTQ
jgi:hypothetical protein